MLTLIFQDDDDEDDEDSDAMRESMIKLHQLYQKEESELKSLLDLAQTTHPELLIQHPQLKVMSKGMPSVPTIYCYRLLSKKLGSW